MGQQLRASVAHQTGVGVNFNRNLDKMRKGATQEREKSLIIVIDHCKV